MNKETESGKTYPDDIKSEGPEKKDIAKAYEKYAKQFTPKPDYFGNCLKAFLVGGLICTASLWYKNMLMDKGIGEEDAAVFVTITLVALAQIPTGLRGVRCDSQVCRSRGYSAHNRFCQFYGSLLSNIRKKARTGSRSQDIQRSRPVLVCGITSAVIVGIIYWIIGMF